MAVVTDTTYKAMFRAIKRDDQAQLDAMFEAHGDMEKLIANAKKQHDHDLIARAVSHKKTSMIAHLLNLGFEITRDALESAVSSGSVEILRLSASGQQESQPCRSRWKDGTSSLR